MSGRRELSRISPTSRGHKRLPHIMAYHMSSPALSRKTYFKLLPQENLGSKCLAIFIQHGLDELYLWLHPPIHPPLLYPTGNLCNHHYHTSLLHSPFQSAFGLRRACCCRYSTLSTWPLNSQAVSTPHKIILKSCCSSCTTTKATQ